MNSIDTIAVQQATRHGGKSKRNPKRLGPKAGAFEQQQSDVATNTI